MNHARRAPNVLPWLWPVPPGMNTAAIFGTTKSGWHDVARDLEPYSRHGNFSLLQYWRQDDGNFSNCYIANDPCGPGHGHVWFIKTTS